MTIRHPATPPRGRTIRSASLAVIAALTFATAGCSLHTPYPSRTLFTISAGEPAPTQIVPAADKKPINLRIRRLIALPPFNTTSFLYRTGPDTIAADYYNTFAAPPADLLTVDVVEWLRQTGLFAAVTDANSSGSHQWALEGRVVTLAIDGSNAAKPEALLTLHIMIWDESGPTARIALDQTYTARAPVSPNDAAHAAAAWGADCRTVFSALLHDLQAAH
jgi:ABC-type uncharacterized transport system auxiliary subunit